MRLHSVRTEETRTTCHLWWIKGAVALMKLIGLSGQTHFQSCLLTQSWEEVSLDGDVHLASTANVLITPLHGSSPNKVFEISMEQLFFPWQACKTKRLFNSVDLKSKQYWHFDRLFQGSFSKQLSMEQEPNHH